MTMMNEPTPRQQNKLQAAKKERTLAVFDAEHTAEPLYGLAPIEGGANEMPKESGAEDDADPTNYGFNLMAIILPGMAFGIITLAIIFFFAHGGGDYVTDLISRWFGN